MFEVEDEYKPVLALSHIANNAIGDIHRMTSFSSTAKDRTDPVEVGAVAYPSLLVKDPAYDQVRQSRETPMWV